MSNLVIANKVFSSRLLLGTGKFASPQLMQNAVTVAQTELVTMALKRVDLKNQSDNILSYLKQTKVNLLPNTSGVRNAKEAIFAAHAAREALQTNWIKLEIHPDPRYLMPDAMETLKATEQLVKDDFIVLPYIHADPVLCKRLEDVGVQAVMPLAAPIGTNKGLSSIDFLKIIIAESTVPVIIDAGLGTPSHAAQAMEIGADAVLVNTAIAIAKNPVDMANAFRMAVEAGRLGFEAGLAAQTDLASASSPLDFIL
ncbi:MAG: thiazole synthase [Chitinophagales bacterium]|nr:thiazole synthase [Chitinophagales bacterium]